MAGAALLDTLPLLNYIGIRPHNNIHA